MSVIYVFSRLGSLLRSILYPFDKVKRVVETVSFNGLSDSGRELLLALIALGELPLNYTHLPKIIARTLNTRERSKATIHDQVRVLKGKGLIEVDNVRQVIKPTMKGLVVAGKYTVLVRMVYTVPMTITLLLLLTILRSWIPLWFLYTATLIAILHHISNLLVLFMKPSERRLSSKIKGLIRLLPESLPIILFFVNTWSRLRDPLEVSVEVLDLETMDVRRKIVKIIIELRDRLSAVIDTSSYI